MSLRVRLLAILGVSLLLLWASVAAWMLADLKRELGDAMDDRLAVSARMVAGLIAQLGPLQEGTLASAGGPLDIVGRDGLVCEVSLVRGEVTTALARTDGAPGLGALAAGYGTSVHGGKAWRTYVLVDQGLRIATADRVDHRDQLMRDMTLTMAVPFAVALCGSMVMLWFGVCRGLMPLERVRRQLATRRPEDGAPIDDDRLPGELRPLTDTINHLLARVKTMLDRERGFVDDAAHELRTPLTAIKTHLQVLRLVRGTPGERAAAEQALDSAELGVGRLHYTLEQLLLLARLDKQDNDGDAPLARAGDAARVAFADVGTDPAAAVRLRLAIGVSDDTRVPVPDALLVAALRNLLENAVRHAPGDSPIVLAVGDAGQGRIGFSVLDDGAGMSEEECRRAVQRFWRRGRASAGSGLGLAIVAAIAQRHGGRLDLARRSASGGFAASLVFPRVGEIGCPEAS